MVYIDINRYNTHADPLLSSRWVQMWVHIWAQTLVILLVYVTKGNIFIVKQLSVGTNFPSPMCESIKHIGLSRSVMVAFPMKVLICVGR